MPITCRHLLGVCAVVAVTSLPADASPRWSGDYARVGLKYEGAYHKSTPCYGHFRVVREVRVRWYGRRGRLRMYYHPSCGAYIRTNNMETYCYLHGLRQEPGEGDRYFGWVTETSDGLTYAYTQMLNNLHGRLANGKLICSGKVIGETGWY